eukprot:TRINITY_DN5339_c0_g1_i1.p1 TRINITY_DN5339_c0_g1~~TRINITY_DN5339_c0_g1_i1.p1  ORF type:complete len:1020 (-),score=216.48 TRINITY_DN5339_c0_g1_i1:201-3131(-)
MLCRLLPRTAFRSIRNFSCCSRNLLSSTDLLLPRHLGPSDEQAAKMLKVCGYNTLDELTNKTVPSSIRISRNVTDQKEPRGEADVLEELKKAASLNRCDIKSYIGAGYYNTHVPNVILRNMLENPAWYTSYTPYQGEVSQGRLQMLLNYQTMIADLTGLPMSNASLLDEGTAAAEAVYMCLGMSDGKRKKFLISSDVHPQTIGVCKTRASGWGVTIEVMHHSQFDVSAKDVCGVLVQYPATDGTVDDFRELTKKVQSFGTKMCVATDLLALTMLAPPGEWGADIALGSNQRFGLPLGYGGPSAGFFATQEKHKRKMPGRIIGMSKDTRGKPALRMAMQTREQHIRREKATSNICTAQALLANMSVSYAIYHGPKQLTRIAQKARAAAKCFSAALTQMGYDLPNAKNEHYFDTVRIDNVPADTCLSACLKAGYNIRKLTDTCVCVAFDETTTEKDVQALVSAFAQAKNADNVTITVPTDVSVPDIFTRQTSFLTHSIFNSYHSETDMMRYLYSLQMRDLSLATAMIPLGSCTMKANTAAVMIPITWPEFANMHPFVPLDQAKGYNTMITQMEKDLCSITGFAGCTLMPNAGSQGEYTGLKVIQAYHASRGDTKRTICLIPHSAHGTNPASAVLSGHSVVEVACDTKGEVDVKDLIAKTNKYKEQLSCLMITYPSTHGVFEDKIKEIVSIIHAAGGQVYMDGANMNAQVGLTSPGDIGADVCHLNLHKTFAIPHGGGGPGVGPICVAKHLVEFLPTHPVIKTGGSRGIGNVSASPFGSASILPISWVYIKGLGSYGLKKATQMAILNANYMMKKLAPHYKVLYTGKYGQCAHEFIIDIRPIKAQCGISEEDIAKRLMDYNFHAPTMSFPVPGTLMIEPTESEPLYEIDRFIEAMISIRNEIKEVESGKMHKTNNCLKNAPHPADVVLADKWDRPYSREKAAYPLSYLRLNKFWPYCTRVDNVFGDRNLQCVCPPVKKL